MYAGGANQINPAGQECWARAWLISGNSRVRMWVADESTAKTRVAIGSSEACDWPIDAPSLAPVHAELYWDGQALWAGSAAGARIDGRPLQDWVQVSGRVSLDMGGATIAIETSDADAKTQVASAAHMQAMGQAMGQSHVAAGRIGQTGLGPSAPTPSNLSSLGPLGAPANGEATVIVSELGPGAMFPPGMAAGQAPVAPTPTPPRPQQHAPAAGFESAFPPSHTPSQFSMPPRGQKRPGSKTSIPPRTWALIGATVIAFTFVFLLGDEDKAPQPRKKAVAAQTAGDKAGAPTPPAQADKTLTQAAAGGASAEAADKILADAKAEEAPADTGAEAEAAPDAAGQEPERTIERQMEDTTAAVDSDDGEGEVGTLASEEEAARSLVQGRYEEALALYSELAARHPDREVFRTTERILKRKIKEKCAATRSCR